MPQTNLAQSTQRLKLRKNCKRMIEKGIEEIAVHYGTEHQILKCIEELGELASELSRYWQTHFTEHKSSKPSTIFDVGSELADVSIMIGQIKHLLGLQSMVDEEIEKKLNRQINRMKEEKGNENVEKYDE